MADRWRRGLQSEGMGRWTHTPHPREAEGTVKPRTGKGGRRCGRRRDRRKWRRGEGERRGDDFRGAVGLGEEGREDREHGRNHWKDATERTDPARQEHSCTGDGPV